MDNIFLSATTYTNKVIMGKCFTEGRTESFFFSLPTVSWHLLKFDSPSSPLSSNTFKALRYIYLMRDRKNENTLAEKSIWVIFAENC